MALFNTQPPTLYYVYDPMCSWCWGFHQTWEILQKQLAERVDIRYCVGGLAPDSEEPMPEAMQAFLQQTWRKIGQQLGTAFNFDFWQQCQPRRSTYPACRAVILAREQGLEKEMCLAIQQGYYLQAQNPSDLSTLVSIAERLGMDVDAFRQNMLSRELNQQLLSEISFARSLPIQGFPSLVLVHQGQQVAIEIDYQHWQNSYHRILAVLSNE